MGIWKTVRKHSPIRVVVTGGQLRRLPVPQGLRTAPAPERPVGLTRARTRSRSCRVLTSRLLAPHPPSTMWPKPNTRVTKGKVVSPKL